MKAPRKSPSNRSAIAKARRSFLTEQQSTVAEPLTPSERSELFDLIDDSHSSNHRLLNDARELEEARAAFEVARVNLEIAETGLAQEHAESQRLHTKMAPLLHRLAV